jgi:shikimate dehydrogenase
MKRAGVIGHPIAHSRSPRIHGHWLQKYNIEGEYKAYDVHPHQLKDDVLRLRDEGLAGCNVTLPHKQNIMEICTTLNDEAKRIGAVNTLVFYPSGEIEGRNTDAFGFMRNAAEAHPDFLWNQGPAVVLGAGGAARAIVYALKRAGVPEIRLTNRTIETAEALADEFDCVVHDWDQRHGALEGASCVINTTSLGMTGQPPLEIDLAALKEDSLVYDIVYAPLMTRLLEQADARGCRVVTGIGMLLHQARPGFQAWFGLMPEVDDELRSAVLA